MRGTLYLSNRLEKSDLSGMSVHVDILSDGELYDRLDHFLEAGMLRVDRDMTGIVADPSFIKAVGDARASRIAAILRLSQERGIVVLPVGDRHLQVEFIGPTRIPRFLQIMRHG